MKDSPLLQLWYKNAVLYCLDVETFQDSDGDGVGDFCGLTQRLDYLSGLGVTCLWLLPFYPTPNRDNGYDVKDYFNVDPRLGDLGDFVDFVRAADERGIRVIIDLVANHTSVDHPWFQQARSSPDSPYRDYYLWRETKPEGAEKGLVFPGYQTTTWTYDEQADAYYYHRFYDHQAELNIANPAVRDKIRQVMAFWLKLGVSGFRVDAVPFLIELDFLKGVKVDEPQDYLSEFRSYLSWQRGDAVLLAEANISMAEVPEYFGQGERFQMMFNFVINQFLMLSLVRGDATPLYEAWKTVPQIPGNCQWAHFMRNHDELSLDRLSDSEREEVYREFAPDEEMRIYNRGIRRRMPPMLGGDQKRLKLTQSLLFTLPGTPVLRYGEEIGMGEDLSLPERNSIRTPMQWSDEPGGGFSKAPADQLVRPLVDGGEFGYQNVNVARQERDNDSVFTVTERMIRARKENPAFGWGENELIATDDPHILAHRCDWQGTTIVVVHNLDNQTRTFALQGSKLETPNESRRLQEILSDARYDCPETLADPIELQPYGYRWFRLSPE